MMLVLTLLTRLLQDCLSMSGQDGYNWMDLQCQTRDHMGTMHYAVCENRKG